MEISPCELPVLLCVQVFGTVRAVTPGQGCASRVHVKPSENTDGRLCAGLFCVSAILIGSPWRGLKGGRVSLGGPV